MMWRLSICMQLVLLLHCVVGYLNVHTPVEHSCDFEISFCGWFNSDKDNLDWARHQGLTPTRRGGKILTGPLADHTLGNSSGFYLYMETSTHKSGQYSDFISEIDSDIHGARLSFCSDSVRGRLKTVSIVEIIRGDTAEQAAL
ncbi:hypothetical protein RRG08_031625 [Elysia crispata]|uniref:MAM domain-containing protein n=1 Tax=Elysia crispata TaxID=231223 RepID=A0AAE0ZN91_9GAST|nr:hypothetical protein RRG08_031625 [Elysia crispata]